MVTLFLSGHTFQIFVVGNSHQSAADCFSFHVSWGRETEILSLTTKTLRIFNQRAVRHITPQLENTQIDPDVGQTAFQTNLQSTVRQKAVYKQEQEQAAHLSGDLIRVSGSSVRSWGLHKIQPDWEEIHSKPYGVGMWGLKRMEFSEDGNLKCIHFHFIVERPVAPQSLSSWLECSHFCTSGRHFKSCVVQFMC